MPKNVCENCLDRSKARILAVKRNNKIKCDFCNDYTYNFISTEEIIEKSCDFIYKYFDVEQCPSHSEPFIEEFGEILPPNPIEHDDFRSIIMDHIEGATSNLIYEISKEIGNLASIKIGRDSFSSEKCIIIHNRIISNSSEFFRFYDFEQSLKHKNRFFNEEAKSYLDDIFKSAISSGSVSNLIKEIGPRTNIDHLYRARLIERNLDKIIKRPDKELSAPPAEKTASGRMNAKGIPVFYGATDPEIALSEIRPSMSDRVAIVKFNIIKNMKLLDLSSFENTSMFDPNYFSEESISTYRKVSFLADFAKLISRPISPRETDIQYVVTQYISEYIASNKHLGVSGLIFKSSQTTKDGRNIVLFDGNFSCKLTSETFEQNAEIYEEPEWDAIYLVENEPFYSNSDDLEVSLEVNRDDFSIHTVTDILYYSQKIEVKPTEKAKKSDKKIKGDSYIPF